MYDRIDAPVPAAALRPMFVYRHRQLADDLAAHRDARDAGAEGLVVAVTGATGLVGTALSAFLSSGGHRVIRLVRHPAQIEDERQWNPDDPAPDLLSGVDAVVHLAGASIAGRFTAAHKKAVRDSRIGPTRRLAEVAAAAVDGPRTFVSASAIGIYGFDRGDALLCEESRARRRLPRRCRRGLGGRHRARRRSGTAGRQRANRNRAVRQPAARCV